MVFQCLFYMWTIGANGFSMVFQISTIGINGFSMVFSNPTIAIEWMVLWLTIDIDGFPMVLGKVKAGSQKKAKKQKKAWFVQQIPRGEQSLDRLTWPNVTKKLQKEHP